MPDLVIHDMRKILKDLGPTVTFKKCNIMQHPSVDFSIIGPVPPVDQLSYRLQCPMSNSINCVKRSYKHHNFCKHLRRTWPASHSLASNQYLASVFDPRAWLPWTPKIPEIYSQVLVGLVSTLGDFTRLGWAHDLLISNDCKIAAKWVERKGSKESHTDIHTFLTAVIRPRDVICMILLTNNV